METVNLISINQFCKHYNVPIAFINTLKEYDLIEIVLIKNDSFLKLTQLDTIEKIMRLHFDLDINFEGIDVIYNLLKQVETLKNELTLLQNKLSFYND